MILKSKRVAKHYDHISPYIHFYNRLKEANTRADFTFHKPLRAPDTWLRANPSESPTTYLHHLILSMSHFPDNPYVLDAGCGFGGTIFWFHERVGGVYDGLSLSEVQLKIARQEAERRQIAKDCHFHLSSYDEPLTRTYDVVMAIESLVHSHNLPKSLQNLAMGLKPEGQFVVAEEMLADHLSQPDKDVDVALVKQHWQIRNFPQEIEYRTVFQQNGLIIESETDLSNGLRIVNKRLADLFIKVCLSLHKISGGQMRSILSFYVGYMALQRLYRKKKMRYKLIVAQKRANRSREVL